MRILILSQWYAPEPGRVVPELAESLQAAGHEVTVLSGFPNYPSGNLFPGYRIRLFQKETIDGIRVIRVPLYPDHGRSGFKRAANYLSFAFSCLVLAPWLAPRVDLIHVYNMVTLGPAAWLLSKRFRVPFTYEIQDIWPETLAATKMVRNERVLALVGRFAKWVYRRAAGIRVISPGFRDNLIEKGVAPEKIQVIPNWVDADAHAPRPPDAALAERLGLAGRFNVMFAGAIGLAQHLETVLDAAALLVDLPQSQFVLVGDGADLEHLQGIARERQLENVKFLGRFPSTEMPRLYALADALLVHLRDEPLFRITIPHKVYSYMAAGRPVLAAMAGDAAEAILSARAGLTCPPGDPLALAETVRRLAAMPPAERQLLADNGRRAACEKFDRGHVIRQIGDWFEAVVGDYRREKIGNIVMSESDAPFTAGLWRRSRIRRILKRAFDVAFAMVVLIVLSSLMLLIAVLIKCTSRGPVFFRQRRLGRDGRIFEIMKFRTMIDRAWEQGPGLSIDRGDTRITAVGRFLRVSHLDELPQFFNVLRGDMSVVGPRPTLPFHYDYYEPWERQRLEMPPGITGWAQANGATALGWDERFMLDVWYVQHWSLWLDARIILRTCFHVAARLIGRRDTLPPSDGVWSRGKPADLFTHSGETKNTETRRQSADNLSNDGGRHGLGH